MWNALYLSPGGAYISRDLSHLTRSKLQLKSQEVNLVNNESKGIVSKQTMDKIKRAVQWLVFLAPDKKTTCPDTQAVFSYRAGLVTVALPTGCNDVDPGFFRKVLLSSLLDAMQHHWNLGNYIWKLERQKNGALHAHVTVDAFIPHKWLNEFWCSLLSKHGLLHAYHQKFSSMSKGEYIAYRHASDYASHKAKFPSLAALNASYAKAFTFGERGGWLRPNCTDVASVRSVKSLASYLAKYLAKDSGIGPGTRGRVWSCNHALSQLKSVKVGFDNPTALYVGKCVTSVSRWTEDLWITDRLTGDPINFASVTRFVLSRSQLLCSPLVGEVFRSVISLFRAGKMPERLHYGLDDYRQLQLVTQNP